MRTEFRASLLAVDRWRWKDSLPTEFESTDHMRPGGKEGTLGATYGVLAAFKLLKISSLWFPACGVTFDGIPIDASRLDVWFIPEHVQKGTET